MNSDHEYHKPETPNGAPEGWSFSLGNGTLLMREPSGDVVWAAPAYKPSESFADLKARAKLVPYNPPGKLIRLPHEPRSERNGPIVD